jgi:hypothetical protein
MSRKKRIVAPLKAFLLAIEIERSRTEDPGLYRRVVRKLKKLEKASRSRVAT